ncbi:MAG: cation diffusion facilitator family transporter [Bacteroidia bacterium]|nr:cation diffusion facilitator family transporter [Bacteroidia bacterium]
MGHHHNHDHSHHQHHGTGNIKVAFFLNLGFTLIEIVGGILTNSVAIISDAIHDLGDSLSLGLSWYFQSLSSKKGDAQFSFGYQRFSLLGAVINSIVLIVGGIFVLQEAIPRLWEPSQPNAEGMIYLAILGIAVNGAAVLRLRKGSSINEEVVSLHLLEDVLGWVAVLIAAIVMQFVDAPILDPLLSILITAWVLWNVYRNLRKSFKILLQAVPGDKDITELKRQIQQIPEIANVHDIHLWTLDGEKDIFTVHVKLDQVVDFQKQAAVKATIRQILAEQHIEHVTIEVESEEEDCEQIDCQ